MTNRADLTDLLLDLERAIYQYQEETRRRFSEMEQRITRLETARMDSRTGPIKTWTALLKPIIIKIAIKLASPHFYAALTFLMSVIGRTVRGWLGW